ncbi:glycosyltransferase [Lunatimonas lonarensis]|nr:glycosyltransferase [Lunatimonas lonarensis]
MKKHSKFSCLVCVYDKDDPIHFDECLQSIFNQSLQASEVLLVQDGAINVQLKGVVEKWSDFLPVRIVVNEQNLGLGQSLNLGVPLCRYDLIARMDADDICHPSRFEKQVAFLDSHPEISVVGSWIAEFQDTLDNIVSYRKLPADPDELFSFAKRRCPLNHPTVMFRKDDVLAVGNYDPYANQQDYQLWARLLVNGYKFANIQESLLFMRISSALFKRRGGINYGKIEFAVQRDFLRIGFINRVEFVRNVSLRMFVRLMPNSLRKLFYKRLLR